MLITGNSGGHLGLLRGKIQRFRLVLGQIGDAAALTEFTKPTSPGQCSSQGSLASDGGLRETCWPFVTVESDRGLAPLTGTGNVQWVRPAELVKKSLPSSSGLPQSWHCSAELMSPLWNSLSGAFQLWIGPKRTRHSNPFGCVAGRVVMKPNLLGAAGRVRTHKRPTWFSRQFRRKALKITGGQGNSHWQGNRGDEFGGEAIHSDSCVLGYAPIRNAIDLMTKNSSRNINGSHE